VIAYQLIHVLGAEMRLMILEMKKILTKKQKWAFISKKGFAMVKKGTCTVVDKSRLHQGTKFH
jgi:hypothetical protein